MTKKKLFKNLMIPIMATTVVVAPTIFAVSCSDTNNINSNKPKKTIQISNEDIANIKAIILQFNDLNFKLQDILNKIKKNVPNLAPYIDNLNMEVTNNNPNSNINLTIYLSDKVNYKVNPNSGSEISDNILSINNIPTNIKNIYEEYRNSIIGPSSITLKQQQTIDLNVEITNIENLNKNYPNWVGEWIKDGQVLETNNDVFIDGNYNSHLQIVSAKTSTKGVYQYRINFKNDIQTYINSNQVDINVLGINDKPTTNPSFKEFYNDGYSTIGTYADKVLNNNVARPTSIETYDTELWRQYHNSYGFIYPGWNRNYEEGNNRYFSNDAGTQIDAKELVYNERVQGDIKYNDSNWILEQIKAGTLKKHPAADNFYESSIANIPAVEKEFIISTISCGPINLGLYAPPGEIITIEFEQNTYDFIKSQHWEGLKFVINQNYWDNRDMNDSGGISNRYPFIRTIFPSIAMDDATRTLKIGSPFGGGLSIWLDSPFFFNNGPFNNNSGTIKFKVMGAIECIHYIDGFTTKDSWDNELKLFKQQKLAPIIQADSAYFGLTIPSTGIGQIGYVNVDEMVYPKSIFKKWNDFLFLSSYYQGRDIDWNNIRKLNMEFCNDIWGGAAAWGGGDNFYCPSDWGANALFKNNPVESFSPSNSWGVFHEINHNYQQNAAFFNKRGHGETNQVTMFNLSVIGDVGRYRNELNYNGEFDFKITDVTRLGWSRLDNPYINILNVLESNQSDEYPVYANLLYFMGSKNYSDYVRWDVRNHSNDSENWNGLEEIRMLSENFKLNFWPTFEQYGKWWCDHWPTSYESATAEQKSIIDDLNNKYPAVDFVGNLYATGNYIYDSVNNYYVYGGDTLPPFEIIANESKEFDLDKFIISTNENFAWDSLEFPETSALGASISYNPETKILTYHPQPSSIGKIDEFDITIHPSNFANKPKKYVPGYKFKIKLKTIANCGIVEKYSLTSTSSNKMLEELHSTNEAPLLKVPFTRNGNYIFSEDDNNSGRKIKFKFVAPETADYNFSARWDDLYDLYVNDKKVFHSTDYQIRPQPVYSVHLEKGQELKFVNEVVNLGGPGGFEIYVSSDTIPDLNLFNNIVLDNIDNIKGDLTINQILNQVYEPRTINYTIFNESMTKLSNQTNKTFPVVDNREYKISSPTPSANPEALNDYGTSWCEVWNQDAGPNSAGLILDIKTRDNKRIDFSSILMGCRWNNHSNARPTEIEIKINDENDQLLTIYKGPYLNRSSKFQVFNLDKTYNTNRIFINMVNTKQNGISLWFLNFGKEKYIGQSNSIALNNPNVNISNDWTFKYNDDTNFSALNNCYVTTDKKNATIEFVLNNVQSFDLIGQTNNLNAGFDVYINDNLYKHVDINNDTRNDNSSLFSYHQSNPGLLKIKIVTTTTNPLYLNYVMTFGNNVSII